MSKKKQIDHLFQERFKDFDAVPDEKIWKKIQAQQQKKERKVLLLPFWLRLAGVAAIVAIVSTLGVNFFNQKNIRVEKFVNKTPLVTEKERTTEITLTKKSSKKEHKKSLLIKQPNNNSDDIIITNNTVTDTISSKMDYTPEKSETKTDYAASNRNQTINRHTKTPLQATNIPTKKQSQKEHPAIAQRLEKRNKLKNNKPPIGKDRTTKIPLSKSEEATMAAINIDTTKKSIYEAVNRDITLKDKESSEKRWTITPTIAPVFYNSLGDGSSIAAAYNDNDKTTEANLSYGIQIAYEMNDRVQIRGGIHKLNLTYTTQDVGLSKSITPETTQSFVQENGGLSLIDLSNQSSQENLSESPITTDTSIDFVPSPTTIANRPLEGIARQRIGYIEMPLEITYTLLDNRFGIHVIGGVSTLLLNENENSLTFDTNDGASTPLGKPENLNTFSFSSNLGLGIDYKISHLFKVHLEPIFKYQINAYTSTTDFDPYIFGIYTGASFRF